MDKADIFQLYGRFERVVKWLKYFIIIGVCVLMIVINVGGEYDILLRIRYGAVC